MKYVDLNSGEVGTFISQRIDENNVTSITLLLESGATVTTTRFKQFMLS